MCWHNVTKFCCCLPLKGGAWIVSISYLSLVIYVLVESMIQPQYQTIWFQSIVQQLRLENKIQHQIMAGVLLGIGTL